MNSKQRRQYKRKARHLFPIGCKVRIRHWFAGDIFTVTGYHAAHPERVQLDMVAYTTWPNLRRVKSKGGGGE